METPPPPPPPSGNAPPPPENNPWPPPRRDTQPLPDPDQARKRLLGPGIALAVISAMGILYMLFNMVFSGDPTQSLQQVLEIYREMGIEVDEEAMTGMMDMFSRFQKPMFFMQLVSQCLILTSGICMIRMRSWNICVAGAILALIPCLTGCCCLFDIPLGIWALVVLNDSFVKQSFT